MMNALAAALVAVGAMLVFFLQQRVMLLHGAGLPDVRRPPCFTVAGS